MSRRPVRRDEGGYAAVLAAVFISLVVVPCCAIAVDVARMYLEIQRVQNAADAAALAGVTFLPDDAAASAAAVRMAGTNGYTETSGGSSTVTAGRGSKPTQLKVTVTSTIPNSFAAAIGMGFATVSRSATADYSAPAPMGSPCNTFSNEPVPGAAETEFPGQQWVAAEGGAPCSASPNFWTAIAGPTTPKGNGDAIMTRTCDSGNSGCSGTRNQEFRADGYYYTVKIGAAAVGTPVTLQLFDPAWVEVGDKCTDAPTRPGGFALADAVNPFTTDPSARYATGANTPFCSGDVLNDGASPPLVTSFGLRAPTVTYRPADAAPMTSCAKQFQGYKKSAVSTETLRQTKSDGTANPGYRPEVAKVFRQWVSLCSFTPAEAGTYYLQVRTNVAFDAAHQASGDPGISTGSNQVFAAGDDTSVVGVGNNRFAIRAVGPQRRGVTISGLDDMGIYANYPGARTEFNLVQVLPAAATKSLVITFFDVGDADQAGTIKVLPPVDSNISGNLAGCTGSGVTTSVPSCQLSNVSSGSGWNGKRQTVRVPIPADYSCESSKAGGCWFRLAMDFPAAISDTTTWSARVEGDPVRLIE